MTEYMVKVEPLPGSGKFEFIRIEAPNDTEAWTVARREWRRFGPSSRVVEVWRIAGGSNAQGKESV